ncbi:MAG TPA: ribonuclease J [Bacillota bacterium]|nr:ribonuclease J [Bacillota bacterium]
MGLFNRNDRILLIPLGGLGEIGKNMMVVEYNKEIIIIDAGLMFPDEDMLGIDLVIPDVSFLVENRERVKGIFLTHGHEDHIGALPYILKQLNVPIYGTKLTLGLAKGKLDEHGMLKEVSMNCIKAGDQVKTDQFLIEFIHVNHSIADVVAMAIHTPVGIILHTADFKFDHTPVDGRVTDFRKLAELGDKGILVLLSDSTNVERTGYTPSERELTNTFEELFLRAGGRILVATFASNIHRIQQIINTSLNHNRKVTFAGRSMVNVATIARDLGYLQIPDHLLVDLDEIDQFAPDQITIITTGSQGEPMSALSRMSTSDHKKITIIPGDTVIISASAIPGNEKMVARTINHLFKQGAAVIYESASGIHVSGHASQEELKLMLNLTKPKFFMPVHGEYRHLVQHARLAIEVGVNAENVIIAENGDIVEVSKDTIRVAGKAPSGKVFVDGLGVGDVGNIVLRDRKQLSQDGILIVVVTIDKDTSKVVAGPDIVSRGFVYVRESEDLIEEAKEKVKLALEKCSENSDWATMKNQIKEILSKHLYGRMKRRPMILPIIMEV